MTNSGKYGRCFDEIKEEMSDMAHDIKNLIENYLKEDELDSEDGFETLYDIKSYAEGIITEAEFLLNKEYDK